MPPAKHHNGDSLREACLREALNIIETAGLENLSLREVARRLGVSHQAPYKHFPSREHILAEVIRRAYDAFANYLDQRPQTGHPSTDLNTMGQAYLDYALKHPLQYRLMFGTPLPDPTAHPDMMRSARHAFDLLRQAVSKRAHHTNADTPPPLIDQDALFIWATLHGLASILKTDVLHTLQLPRAVLDDMVRHTFQRISAALDDAPPSSPT
jgi:AcrR family transcriptional regulator